ncbi:MAG: hypothetical protein U1E48_10960 [Paracoccaceae bacterium]
MNRSSVASACKILKALHQLARNVGATDVQQPRQAVGQGQNRRRLPCTGKFGRQPGALCFAVSPANSIGWMAAGARGGAGRDSGSTRFGAATSSIPLPASRSAISPISRAV